MAKLDWDQTGERYFESGIDHGVLYPSPDVPGVVWNGITAVSEKAASGEVKAYYIDGMKYLNKVESDDYSATIESFSYPEELDAVMGTISRTNGLFFTRQPTKSVRLSYRTWIGNDTEGQNLGYKIHMVYNASITPSDKAYKTINESIETLTFSFDIDTKPIFIVGRKPTAHLIVDSTKTDPEVLTLLEDILYGTLANQPRMPDPEELLIIFAEVPILIITDNGDGTWTATGPDSVVSMTDSITFQITSESAVFLDADTYTVDSLSI